MRRLLWLPFLFSTALLLLAQTADPLSLEEVIFLRQMKKSDAQILELIETRGVSFHLDPPTQGKLRAAGFGDRFEREMRKILFLAEVIVWRREGKGPEEIALRIRKAGVTVRLTAKQLLRLRKAGLSPATLHLLQGTGAPPLLRGYRRFEHPARLYRFQFPQEWRTLREVTEVGMTYSFTPQAAAKTSHEITYGVAATSFGAGPTSPYAHLPLEAVNEKLMRLIREQDRSRAEKDRTDFRGTQKERTVLGGLPAIRNTIVQRIKGTAVKGWIFYTYADQVIYLLGMTAPEERFEEASAVFQKIQTTFELRSNRFSREDQVPARPQSVVKEYKESVVRIWTECEMPGGKTERFSGTGFFVRKDGYLLTNAHVVDIPRGKRKRVWIQWDSTLKRAPVDATVIGAVRSNYPKVDVALLRVPGDGYKPFDLSRTQPQGKYVKEQDRVLTLGFPGITDTQDPLLPLTLTTTEGAVSRFVLQVEGRINYLYVTAPIHKGNSGGPCFNLETHAVIGLNSFGSFDPIGRDEGVHVFSAGYSGVIPIDAALEHFPEILGYPDRKEGGLSADEFVSLGIQYLYQGLVRPAIRQFRKALERKADVGRAHAYLGRAQFLAGNREEAIRCSKRALELDPKNVLAMITQAMLQAQMDRTRSLAHLNRALEVQPRNAEALLLRGELHRAMGEYDKALEDARRARHLSGDMYGEPLRSMAETCLIAKRYAEGRRWFEEALRLNPEDAAAHVGRARSFELEGDLERAGREYEGASKRFPDDPTTAIASGTFYLNRALRLKGTRLYTQAFEHLKRGFLNYRKRRQVVPVPVVLSLALAATEGPANLEMAENLYESITFRLIRVQMRKDGTLLRRHPDARTLQLVYLRLAEVYRRGKKNPGSIPALVRAAREIDPKTDLGRRIPAERAGRQTALGLEEFLDLNGRVRRDRISVFAAADIVRNAELGFPAGAKELARKVHPVLLRALQSRAQTGRATPTGFRTYRHPDGVFSVSYPASWRTIDLRRHQEWAPWFFHAAVDTRTGAEIDVYHLANAVDFRAAWHSLAEFFRTMGGWIEVASQRRVKVGPYTGIFGTGRCKVQTVSRWQGVYLATPQGIIVIKVFVPQGSYEAQESVIRSILGSIRVSPVSSTGR